MGLWFVWCGHAYLFLLTFYREIFDAKQGVFGNLMKILEVIGVMIYITLTINNIRYCTIFLEFKTLSINDSFCVRVFNLKGMNEIPPCLTDPA